MSLSKTWSWKAKNILAFLFPSCHKLLSVSEIKKNVILFGRTFWCQHFTRIILLCSYQILMQIHQFRGTLQDCKQGLAAASGRIGCVINKNPHYTDIPPLSPTHHRPASISKSHTIVMLTELKLCVVLGDGIRTGQMTCLYSIDSKSLRQHTFVTN